MTSVSYRPEVTRKNTSEQFLNNLISSLKSFIANQILYFIFEQSDWSMKQEIRNFLLSFQLKCSSNIDSIHYPV
jgi:hypothetical protein